MLWLCIRLPQLAREALAPVQPAGSQDAVRLADAAVRRAALESLAAWAYQWSSLVSYEAEPPLLWLELGASCALFEGRTALLSNIESGLQQLGYTHACALAPSPTAAALLTQIPAPRHALTHSELRARLDPLLLRLLDLPADTLAALEASGLRRIGELLALPAAAIARRFEPRTLLYLRRLEAAVTDPRPAWRLPPTYRSRSEFAIEIHASTALLFPLQRMLLEFQGYLRARDCAVQRFTLEFEHYRLPPTRVGIGLSAPGREAAQFLTLARERLHSLVLPAPVSALRLEALEFTAPAVLQSDLFGQDAQPLQQWQRLLDRLRARLGEDSIQTPELAADYRPERSWRCATPEQAAAQLRTAGSPDPREPPRPCWLLPEPVRIDAPSLLLLGPERIESGWWDGGDVSRDYYIARSPQGSRLWVFHDRRSQEWFLQGLWA
jgi:protein ImuB